MFTVDLEVDERPPPGPHAGAGGGPTWGSALCTQSQGAQSPGGGGAEGPGLAPAHLPANLTRAQAESSLFGDEI